MEVRIKLKYLLKHLIDKKFTDYAKNHIINDLKESY